MPVLLAGSGDGIRCIHAHISLRSERYSFHGGQASKFPGTEQDHEPRTSMHRRAEITWGVEVGAGIRQYGHDP